MKAKNEKLVVEVAEVTPQAAMVRQPVGRRMVASRKRQRGAAGLLDVALAGLVAAIVGYALYSQFHDSATDSQATSLTDQITSMVGKISNNYGSDYTGFSNTVAINNGYLKNRTAMKVSGTSIVIQPGNGSLTMAPATLVNSNDAGSYTLTNLPDSVCADMVNRLSSLAGQLTVNSTVVKAINGQLQNNLVSCTTGQNTIVAVAGG